MGNVHDLEHTSGRNVEVVLKNFPLSYGLGKALIFGEIARMKLTYLHPRETAHWRHAGTWFATRHWSQLSVKVVCTDERISIASPIDLIDEVPSVARDIIRLPAILPASGLDCC